MIAGIDKIVLQTRDFQLKDADFLELESKKGPKNQPRLLCIDRTGKEVWGQKLYSNQPRTNLDINHQGLKVSFNPSKILHPYDLLKDTRKLREVIGMVEKEMSEVGVKTNLQECMLTRLDLTKQDVMPQPILVYSDAFRMLKGNRTEKREYPSGYSFGNKSRTFDVIFYDKGAELRDANLSNFMRVEVQYLKKPVLQKETTLITLSDVMRGGSDHLTQCYNAFLNNRVFSLKNQAGQQLAIDFNDEVEELKMYRQQYGRSGLNKYLLSKSIDNCLYAIGGVEMLKMILYGAGYQKSAVGKILRDFNNFLDVKGQIDRSRGRDTVAGMISEVRARFAA